MALSNPPPLNLQIISLTTVTPVLDIYPAYFPLALAKLSGSHFCLTNSFPKVQALFDASQ